MKNSLPNRRTALLGTVALSGLAALLAATPATAQAVVNNPAVAVNDGVPPGDILDTTDVNGVGQLVTDNGDGTVGLCTATLINPRTVIFAAHCVNERGAGDYGAAQGGTPIGIGFQADALNGIIDWLDSGYQSNPGDYFYNINHVTYNPHSLDLGPGLNFLQGDVAMGSFDTPAANVPTWTTLFSPLPTPASIDDKTGTGYHVTITGYGMHGNGTDGTTGEIDFRRRSAENIVGILGSLQDVDNLISTVLDGAPFDDGLPQNLYQVDFDDPNRGTPEANPYDVNIFKDDATPKEGITGPGDSGGPLIIDQAFGDDVKTVIGVLSGGSTPFVGQPTGGYGTSSFYQPLYLFWQWIAANNPYRYVSSVAGDGNWTDPSHWVTDLDPAYQIVDSTGHLVNGLPSTPEAGIDGTSPKFGKVCIEQPGFSYCEDLATGQQVYNGQVVSNGNSTTTASGVKISGGPATVDIASLSAANGTGSQGSNTGGAASPNQAATGTQVAAADPLPDPTLANGLPGATDFVPNDTDGDAATGARPYYYDVTLAADGTTTLDSAVTIDRLTVAGKNSNLDITKDGFLVSLIDTTQFGGHVNVDGNLFTVGDYAMLGGLLTGNGAVTTPFLTNVMGVIAPGTVGTAGTLTVNGDLILSSASTLAIDLSGQGSGDLLAVKAIPGTAFDGEANVGGNIIFSAVDGYLPRYHDAETFLTAEGGVTGAFNAGNTISAILYPSLKYTANSVSVQILARDYADVVDTNSPVQRSYAQLLDQSRGNYDRLSNLYGQLDLLPLGSIESTLEAMAPRTETTRTELGVLATDSLAQLYRDRLALGRTGVTGGTLAMIGQPLQLAALSESNMPLHNAQMSDSGEGMVASNVRLPDNVGAYIAGGYLNGSSRSMPTTIDTGRDSLDGYYIAIGAEVMGGEGNVVGASLAYSDTRGDATALQHADGKLYQGTLYGAFTMPGGLTMSSQASAGLYSTDTRRRFSAGTVDYDLHQHDQSLAASAEVNVGKDFGKIDSGLVLTPKVGLRYNHLGFSKAAETGGDAALAVDRTSYDSLQGRAGVDLGGSLGGLKPRLHAAYVHDFADQPTFFGATFVDGVGPPAPFALAGTDRNWGEAGGALRYDTGKVAFDLGVDTTFARSDIDYQTYHGSITFRF